MQKFTLPSSMPKESSQQMHQLRRLKRPTVEMKKTLHRFASVLCLLTLVLNAATCLHAEQPRQSSCSHCPKRAPLSQTLPSCCAAQQQPPAVTSAEIKQPVQSYPSGKNHIDSYRLLAAHAVGVSSGSLWMDKLASPGRTAARYSRTGILSRRQVSTMERIAATRGPAFS